MDTNKDSANLFQLFMGGPTLEEQGVYDYVEKEVEFSQLKSEKLSSLARAVDIIINSSSFIVVGNGRGACECYNRKGNSLIDSVYAYYDTEVRKSVDSNTR